MGIQGINKSLGSPYKQIDHKVVGYEVNGEYKTADFRILQKTDTFTLSKEYKTYVEKEKTPEITGEGESVLVNNSFMLRLKEDRNERNWNLRFDSPDDLLSIVEDGYIEVNGKNIILTDKEKKNFKKIDNEKFKEEMNVLKITLLYGRGKAVSEKDLNYLREKNPKMYTVAVNMRAMQKEVEEDKKKKSVLEEEDDSDMHIDAIEYDEDKIELNIDTKENTISVKTVSEKVIS